MHRAIAAALTLALVLPAAAHAQSTEVKRLASCQKKIAGEGAKYAQRIISSELKCMQEMDECIINCEAGVYGPVCEDPPVPPCCNPEDPNNPLNEDYLSCTIAAQYYCDQQVLKMDTWEHQKQDRITSACSPPNVSPTQLCTTETAGLHFATMAAGCQAVIPGWQCNGIADVLACVGGPLQKQLLDQISGLLDPRAADAVALLPASTREKFANLPVTVRVKDVLTSAGAYDVWSLPSLKGGDPLVVRIETGDDTGADQSLVEPQVRLIAQVGSEYAIISGTNVRDQACAVPNACGQPCPMFKRVVPFDGTFYVAVSPDTSNGCGTSGKYKLFVSTVGGVVPQLVADDVSVAFTSCAP